MSIHFISGKPGGGKTLYAMHLIEHELRNTKRTICTNVAVKPEELAQYLHDKYDDNFDLHNRLRLLNEDEVCSFWTHYGKGLDLTGTIRVKQPDGSYVEHVDYSPRLTPIRHPGCVYVLDEIHEYFNARNWNKTGVSALHYLSQHRKLGDDVFCITQSIGNVDKQFRSVAQDFIYCRNLKKEKIPVLGGILKAPGKITRATYLEPYTGMPGQLAQEVRTVHLDRGGLAKCYDTAGGVGIAGGGQADLHEKNRGLPFWVLPIIAVVGLVLLNYGMDFMSAKLAGKVAENPVPHSFTTNGIVSQIAGPVLTQGLPPAVLAPLSATNEEPYITSLSVIGDMVRVSLSDGRKFTELDIQHINRNFVFIGNKGYKMKGGGHIGIPGMRKSPIAHTSGYPVRHLQGAPAVISDDTLEKKTDLNFSKPEQKSSNSAYEKTSPSGSALIQDRPKPTVLAPLPWMNLPRNGLALP